MTFALKEISYIKGIIDDILSASDSFKRSYSHIPGILNLAYQLDGQCNIAKTNLDEVKNTIVNYQSSTEKLSSASLDDDTKDLINSMVGLNNLRLVMSEQVINNVKEYADANIEMLGNVMSLTSVGLISYSTIQGHLSHLRSTQNKVDQFIIEINNFEISFTCISLQKT